MRCLLSLIIGAALGFTARIENSAMEAKDLLASVRNTKIEFATMRPNGSEFSTLERRVVITGPAELVQLVEIGDLKVLDELAALLRDPDRAWAAQVVLAAMTHTEEKIVDAFAAYPDEWLNSLGKTAYERWKNWLNAMRGRLVWDNEEKYFKQTR